MITYAQHLEFLGQEKERAYREYGCLIAEQQGYKDAATYDAPRLQYQEAGMTERYELGFVCGKVKLQQEAIHARKHQVRECGGVTISQEAGSRSAVA